MTVERDFDSALERLVADALVGDEFDPHSDGRSLPGRPDFYLPTRRIAIFVHGCFWHSHYPCPN
jgi:DNA mismatch endonuclease Vsr